MFMASALGASIWSDMFFIAFKLPNLFRTIFAEGAFTQAFLPSFIASKNKSVFATSIFLRFLLFMVVISIVVTIFPQPVTKLVAWGWNWDIIQETAPLTAINFWYFDFVFIITFLGTLLQYKEHFVTTAMSNILINFTMICTLWLYIEQDPKSVAYALSISVLIGGFLQVAAHVLVLRHFRLDSLFWGGIKYRKTKDIASDTKQFKKLFLSGIIGSSTLQITSFSNTLLATFLVPGSVSFLFYANRVFNLPMALIAISVSTVLFPSVSRALNNGNHEKAYENVTQAFWILAFLLGGATIGGIFFAKPIIWLLFEHGKFSSLETLHTANVLQMYLIGLLPFGLAKLFSLFLYASHKHQKAAHIALYSLIASLSFSLLLIYPMGASGLALASSIGGWVLLALTLKEVGKEKFITIILHKRTVYFLSTMLFLSILFYNINLWIQTLIQ